MRALFAALFLFSVLSLPAAGSPKTEPLATRGYYMTFMRMPLWGLPEWKQAIDCMREDGANTITLWMGGGFRSRKFPATWEYNRDHKNVAHDFARELIEYAHKKEIRVLLGFTPFGYDGVNQFSIQFPDLKARKADGKPVDEFGIHSWGWSLCPSQPKAQQFMLEYAREMFFDFYPNADGLLIEFSDYDVCRCADCGPKYYEKEFAFVRKISDEVWSHNTNATVILFPHYFSGKKVNQGTAIEAQAAKFQLDKRWTLIFSPHSAHLDDALVARAGSTIYWTDSPSMGTPAGIREGAQMAHRHNLSGYMPSLEPFSYVMPRPEFGSGTKGQRVKQLGLDWLPDDAMSLSALPIRLQRFAFKEYSNNPTLSDADFRLRAASHFFNDRSSPAVDDLLFLQNCINLDRTWSSSSPLINPSLFEEKSKTWPSEKLKDYAARLRRLEQIATNIITGPAADELKQIATFIIGRWKNSPAATRLPK